MIDLNKNVPLSAIVNPLKRLAAHATTSGGKKYMYEIVEALGTAIFSQPPGGGNVGEFVEACGVSSEWGKLAA